MFPTGIDLDDYQESYLGHIQAAEIGDLQILEMMETEYGGMRFRIDTAREALDNGYIEYFLKMCLLCRPCLLMNGTDESDTIFRTDSWSRPRSDLIHVVIGSYLPPAKKLELTRDLCEKIFPQFPEREEIEFPVGIQVYRTNSRLPKYPLWEDPDYPNITQTEMEVICLYLVDSIDLFDVLKYFCEQQHLKFTKSMLESFEDSVYPEIWDYVLDHVEESVDISKYRNFIHSVTDGELRDTIFDCFQKMEKNEWTRDQAKFYFKRIFPKREDLVKRSLYIVLMLYELLHGININEHQKVHFNVTLLNLGDNRPSTKIARSQVTFDFLVEALNEIITERITEFPLLNCKIEDLLPDDILPYIVAVQPW